MKAPAVPHTTGAGRLTSYQRGQWGSEEIRKACRAANDPRYAATAEGQAILEAAARAVREARRMSAKGER